jgi:hypothetical protein
MKTWLVRAVDSGNIQRSPTFQAIFTYFYSGSDRLPFPVVFDSAGIDVDKIMANRTPATKKLDIIDAGRYYDVIGGDNKRLAQELLDRWFGKSEAQIPDKEKERITRLYSVIKTDVHTLQMRYRNEALLEAGIPEQYMPGMRVPFRHDENLKLILPVEESVVGKVEDYYLPLPGKQPATRIYGNLTGVNPLKDELTGGIETAKKQVKYFMDTRDKAMEEILKLFSEDYPR